MSPADPGYSGMSPGRLSVFGQEHMVAHRSCVPIFHQSALHPSIPGVCRAPSTPHPTPLTIRCWPWSG